MLMKPFAISPTIATLLLISIFYSTNTNAQQNSAAAENQQRKQDQSQKTIALHKTLFPDNGAVHLNSNRGNSGIDWSEVITDLNDGSADIGVGLGGFSSEYNDGVGEREDEVNLNGVSDNESKSDSVREVADISNSGDGDVIDLDDSLVNADSEAPADISVVDDVSISQLDVDAGKSDSISGDDNVVLIEDREEDAIVVDEDSDDEDEHDDEDEEREIDDDDDDDDDDDSEDDEAEDNDDEDDEIDKEDGEEEDEEEEDEEEDEKDEKGEKDEVDEQQKDEPIKQDHEVLENEEVPPSSSLSHETILSQNTQTDSLESNEATYNVEDEQPNEETNQPNETIGMSNEINENDNNTLQDILLTQTLIFVKDKVSLFKNIIVELLRKALNRVFKRRVGFVKMPDESENSINDVSPRDKVKLSLKLKEKINRVKRGFTNLWRRVRFLEKL